MNVSEAFSRVPQGQWKTITFVAALRCNGMRAPCTVDGSMNGAKFLAYIKQCLAPTLMRKYIVVIDNFPAQSGWHTRGRLKRAVRRLHIGHASILDQAHGLKLELSRKFPSLHDPPPAPSKHLTRCLRNRVQANLPQYSPDLNPIEMPFSKLKASLRKAAERTIPRLRRRIGTVACIPSPRRSFQLFILSMRVMRELDRNPL
jgi:transposase